MRITKEDQEWYQKLSKKEQKLVIKLLCGPIKLPCGCTMRGMRDGFIIEGKPIPIDPNWKDKRVK